jgi:hypothetical protein
MSCSSADLKDYVLGESNAAGRERVEAHVAVCAGCAEDLERLRLTHVALSGLGEEEIPRRIAFVSDKVFEPSWWQLALRSRWMGFAAASLLLAAMIAQALRPSRNMQPPPVDTAALERRIEAEVASRIEPAVAKAMAESEARQSQRFAEAVAAVERRAADRRRMELAAWSDELRLLQRQMGLVYRADNRGFGGPQ